MVFRGICLLAIGLTKENRNMSLYSNVKGIITDAMKINNDKDSAARWIYLLKIISFAGVILIFIIETYSVKHGISIGIDDELVRLCSDELSVFCIRAFLVALIYTFFVELKVREVLVEIKVRKDKNFFPIKGTIEDCVYILFYGGITGKIILDLIICLKGIEVINGVNKIIYLWIFLCGMTRFVHRVYIQNKTTWYYSDMRYTNYFDANGNRIAEDVDVVYRNKIYGLHKEDNNWYLNEKGNTILNKDLPLEKAVQDSDGHIRVHYRGMGERGKEE